MRPLSSAKQYAVLAIVGVVVLVGAAQPGFASGARVVTTAKVNPCKLLTTSELSSLAGVPFKAGELFKVADLPPRCQFSTVGTSAAAGEPPVGTITVVAVRGKQAKQGFSDSLQFMKTNGKPEAVTGLGGKAFYSDTEGLLPQLLVLRKNKYLSLSGGVGTPDVEVLDLGKFTEMATLALGRL